jgi:hypothetical protein
LELLFLILGLSGVLIHWARIGRHYFYWALLANFYLTFLMRVNSQLFVHEYMHSMLYVHFDQIHISDSNFVSPILSFLSEDASVVCTNVQGLNEEVKLETIIHIIEERKVYAYCVQETWLEGDFEQELKNGMKCIHHGPARQNSAKGQGWVGSILSSEVVMYWEKRRSVVFRGGACVHGERLD